MINVVNFISVRKNNVECPRDLKVHDKVMEKVNSIVYLGDVINFKGTADDTIRSRELKSVGIVSQINSILKSVTLGVYYVKTALIL